MKGIDYAFGAHPAPAAVKAAGYGFVCRYVSANPANDGNGKNLLPSELAAILAAGLSVVVVAESTAARMMAGKAGGVADAAHAEAVTAALGMAGMPVYFACDFDATPGDQAAIGDYLDGAASVIGRERTGIYGGYYPVKRALDAGKASWAWQATAWSGGQWEPRANIRQHGTAVVGGVTVDLDEAMTADFGQWPRPAAPAPAPQYPVPASLTQSVRASVTFAWSGSASPHWRVQVRDHSGAIVVSQVVTQPALPGVVLPAPGAYAWRVQAAGDSPFTPWREFTV